MCTKQFIIAGAVTFLTLPVFAQAPEDTEVWEPEPAVVTTYPNSAPSDAIVLFDGTSLDKWISQKTGSSPAWKMSDGVITIPEGGGDIRTKESFGDSQLHIEWLVPTGVEGDGQYRGNSGVFMQGLYEIQILDSYNNRTYSNGQAASLYKQLIPLVNASKPQGEWQTYDIIWTAPKFDSDGSLLSKARITILHNGVLVQNNAALDGPTVYVGKPPYKAHGPGPLLIQDHDSPISFRNIWIRPL